MQNVLYAPSVVVLIYNRGIWEGEAGGLGVQSRPQL